MRTKPETILRVPSSPFAVLSSPSLFVAATRVSKGGDYFCRTLEVRCAIRPSYIN